MIDMKLTLTLFILLLMTDQLKTQNPEKMKIIYVYDALCGWCYGFSPVMEAFAANYGEEVEVEVVSGGMIRGSRIGRIGEVAAYIAEAYKEVERGTGVVFGEAFLNDILKDGQAIFTSIPPAIALSVFKTLRPAQSLAFASSLHKAIYFDGIAPDDFEAYGRLAEAFGLDAVQFVSMMQDEAFQKLAENDFAKSASLGVTGFPTVFLSDGSMQVIISRGFADFETLKARYLSAKLAFEK
jgi:putative protein-disulfide isomerase